MLERDGSPKPPRWAVFFSFHSIILRARSSQPPPPSCTRSASSPQCARQVHGRRRRSVSPRSTSSHSTRAEFAAAVDISSPGTAPPPLNARAESAAAADISSPQRSTSSSRCARSSRSRCRHLIPGTTPPPLNARAESSSAADISSSLQRSTSSPRREREAAAGVRHHLVLGAQHPPCLYIACASGSRRPLFIFFLEQGVGGRPPTGLQARKGGGLAGEGW